MRTHGDFASARETAAILAEAGLFKDRSGLGSGEQFRRNRGAPAEGAARWELHSPHSHQGFAARWRWVEAGPYRRGRFSLARGSKAALRATRYDRFVSFEWEKKWHPEIADAEIALPHFARWFRKNYDMMDAGRANLRSCCVRAIFPQQLSCQRRRDGTRRRKTGGCCWNLVRKAVWQSKWMANWLRPRLCFVTDAGWHGSEWC